MNMYFPKKTTDYLIGAWKMEMDMVGKQHIYEIFVSLFHKSRA